MYRPRLSCIEHQPRPLGHLGSGPPSPTLEDRSIQRASARTFFRLKDCEDESALSRSPWGIKDGNDCRQLTYSSPNIMTRPFFWGQVQEDQAS
jgi:hypothetical protein